MDSTLFYLLVGTGFLSVLTVIYVLVDERARIKAYENRPPEIPSAPPAPPAPKASLSEAPAQLPVDQLPVDQLPVDQLPAEQPKAEEPSS